MPLITIANQTIDFPDTGQSPIWSQAVIAFAEAVEEALAGIVSEGDISKQSFPLSASDNPATDLTVTGFSFASSIVRAGFVQYSVYRSTDSVSVAEAGEINVVYDASRASGLKWELVREAVGDAKVIFTISDDGQFSISTEAIAGASHSGLVYFTGQATLQTA